MNKTAIKNFAIDARNMLIQSAKQMAYEYEIEEGKHLDENQTTVGGEALSSTEYSQRRQLVTRIKELGFQNVMEEVAYTWFNRFTALRFMEVNGYLPSKVRVFTDDEGNFKPMILKEALTVEIDGLDREYVLELIDKQDNDTLYKYLLITQCNALSKCLPEMFEKFGGWTELLFPANLLREGSVINRMVDDIPEDDWKEQVQIIGWLYQYYSTEQNALVYDGSLSKAKVPKELISAATTIYTPDWSVRYMVDNSLGRLWVDGHADFDKSLLKYYLEEAEQEESVKAQLDSIKSEYKNISPEEIRFIDPCMGSGHILVYAFDVLMQIYVSQGWSERDAAVSIIENNLYGMDIDKRAYQLAYFALMMKGRSCNRRFLTLEIKSNLCYFSDIGSIDTKNISEPKLRTFAEMFNNADTIGSLLEVKPCDIDEIESLIENMELTMFNEGYQEKLKTMVLAHKILSQKYDVVVTNPPYLGSNRFAPVLSDFVNKKYPNEKSDLSMAMYRKSIDDFAKKDGFVAFITTSSWFFLSSFEKLRLHIVNNYTFDSIVDYGTELFDGKVGHNPIVSWVTRKTSINKNIIAIRLVDYCYSRRDEKEPEFFEKRNRYTANQSNFSKIPGAPVAYWVSENIFNLYVNYPSLGSIAAPRKGNSTSDNNRFLRLWYEVDNNTMNLHSVKIDKEESMKKRWYPYNKGGGYRKWYGFNEYLIDWYDDAAAIRSIKTAVIANYQYFMKPGLTWSTLTSGNFSIRWFDEGYIFDNGGCCIFELGNKREYLCALLNSCVFKYIFGQLNPTLNFQSGEVAKFPIVFDENIKARIDEIVSDNVSMSKTEYNCFETSWDFEGHPLV